MNSRVYTPPCADCPRKYPPIPGDGPQPARALVIGERPGRDERIQGRVFVGKTGQEFDSTYLPLGGLQRRGVRVCNTVRCYADNNRTPSPKEALACGAAHLPEEIARTEPEFIVLMGGTACSLLPQVSLDRMHGIPQHTNKVGELFGWSGWVVPMYHPALGLHESRWMTQLLEDWSALGKTLGEFVHDPEPTPTHYRVLSSWEQPDLGMTESQWIGVDTESHGREPWSVQWSKSTHHAFLLRADDSEGIRNFRKYTRRATFVMHNAGHDMEILRQLDIHPIAIRDTMQEAFHLGNLPQGLKSLVYRLFRAEMTSWEDVVRPDSITALQHWLAEGVMLAQSDLYKSELKQLKTKTREERKPSEAERVFTRLLNHSDVDSDYDPWLRLREFAAGIDSWQLEYTESHIGPYPILGIGNCNLDRAVSYACSDADHTLQVAYELERRRRYGAFRVYEDDRDA